MPAIRGILCAVENQRSKVDNHIESKMARRDSQRRTEKVRIQHEQDPGIRGNWENLLLQDSPETLGAGKCWFSQHLCEMQLPDIFKVNY